MHGPAPVCSCASPRQTDIAAEAHAYYGREPVAPPHCDAGLTGSPRGRKNPRI